MLKRLTIRQRIVVTFITITLIGSIVQLIIAGWQLQQATLEFYQHHLETDALMIASTLAEPMEHYLEGEGSGEMQRMLASIRNDLVYDYLIVDHDYQIVGFTAGRGYETLTSVSETLELSMAASDRIGSDVRKGHDGTEHLFVAVPLLYERHVLGYLVLSSPMQPAYDDVFRQWLELSSTTLPVTVLVIASAMWLSGTISHPVRDLRNSALEMAKGAFDTRIDVRSNDEVGQLAQSFNYMAEQIEVLMKAQRSFVSNAAHELRTPLMMLKLRVEGLQDPATPEEDRTRYIDEIYHEIDHMADLVSSLLVLARIDDGRHARQGHVSDTNAALKDILRRWRIATRQKGLELEQDIPDPLPALNIASNDLRLILDNLLGNALKYTPDGRVFFTAEHQGDQIVLKVSDTGVGFEPAQQSQLFDRFFRSEQVRSQYGGHGLGLAIVHAVLQQYDGDITAHSPGLGQGATFSVTLPVHSASSLI